MCWFEGRVEENREAFVARVSEPRFACKRCGRVANKKRWVCKPLSLKNLRDGTP
jgi:hypothetical protein